MFSRDVSGNVPLYGQELCYWCGAASGKMTMNGYPDPAHRLLFTQLSIWNSIQVNNSILPADSGWATDPLGLKGSMMSMNPPPPGHGWYVFAESARDQLMFWIFYWMNQNQYPVPVLINQGGHWVVIVGYQTDVAPAYGSSPVLQQIHFLDPEPHFVGTDTTMTAAAWYGAPFNGAIIYAGSWLNKYVAVIEPPQRRGRIIVKPEQRIGEKVITPGAAVEHARRWIKELRLAEKPGYGVLGDRRAANLEPMVVREQIQREGKQKKVPYYYVVPFGLKSETGNCGSRLARAVVVVNAFTGQFEEVTSFGRPIRYLLQAEALSVAASALSAAPQELRQARAELMFTPSEITHIRAYPFWKITIGKRILYIDQLGTIYKRLVPSIPGD